MEDRKKVQKKDLVVKKRVNMMMKILSIRHCEKQWVDIYTKG